jgi:hypothetical protein
MTMRHICIFTLLLALLITSCEEEEIPINPLPSMYHNMTLQTRLEHQLGENTWTAYSYVTIFIGSEGKYCTVNEGNDNSFPGSINWHMEDGIQKFNITSDDRNNERNFTVNRYDENHLLVEIDWGPERQEWLLTTGRGALTGAVTDDQGYPLQNATVMVKDHDDIIGQVQTDSYGYFGINTQSLGFAGLFDANNVIVYKEDKEDAEADINVNEGGCTFYLFSMNEGISSLNFGTVTGTVTDEDGNPLEDVTVNYNGGPNPVSTDSNGEFTIQVPLGLNTLTATLDGYDPESQSITIESLGEYQEDFIMAVSGYNLDGSVTSASGTAISGATLTFEDEYGNTITTAASGADGTFSFEGVEDGIYILSISATGWNIIPNNYPVAVQGGDILDIHFLALEEGKTGIGGQVIHWDDDESPVAGAQISATGNTTQSSTDGYYILELQNSGVVIVESIKEGFLNRYVDNNMSPNEFDYFNIDMAPPASTVDGNVEGYVWDSSTGDPIYEATIDVVDNNQTTSDNTGHYSINIDIYDEGVAQIIKVVTSKTGYEQDTIYLDIYRDFPNNHDLYLTPEKKR